LDGTITGWNAAAEVMCGYSAEEIVGKSASLLFGPDNADELVTILQHIRSGKPVERYETTRVAKDGHNVSTLLTVLPIVDSKGHVVGASSIARDITERERIQDQANRASQYALGLIEAAPDAVIIVGPDGRIAFVNTETERQFGYTKKEIIGNQVEMLIPESFHSQHKERRRRYASKPEVRRMGTDLALFGRRKDGSEFPADVTLSPVQIEPGMPGVFAAVRDVTEQNRVNQYARSLIEASLDPLVTISPEGKITDVNEATIRVTGAERDRIVGTDFSDYFTEPDKARDGYRQVFAEGFVTDYPLTIRHTDGGLTDVLYNASVYKDAGGNVLGVFAAARDVTDSKRVLREFTETKTFLDNILESSTKYSIIGKDLDHRILSWNEGARRNYGYAAEEIIGSDSSVLHTPEDIQSGAVDRLLATALQEGLAEDVFQRVRKDGTRFYASVVVTRRDDSAGHPIGFLLMSNDISERIQADLELERSNAELESFSYSVAHDLRVPLRAIDGFSRILIEDHADDLNEEGRRVLGVVIDSVAKMGSLVDDILSFSRLGRSRLSWSEVDMDSVVSEVGNELRSFENNRDIEFDVGSLGFAKCDRNMLRQVWVNLISNALKFTRPRATARIAIRTLEGDGESVFSVADNGVGFNMKYANKLFDVFERLQSSTEFEGTGIGLAIVQRIVERHGGRVWAEGVDDVGSTFYFSLRKGGTQ
jgi:PAS domain S-box-containing protein